MLRGRGWFSVGALIALSTGCSLVVSTSGLTGGGDTPTNEGGVDGGAGDAAADVSADATDARPTPDAGDGGNTPFCASLTTKPTFCADFDVGALGDLGSLVGSPALDTSAFVSSPRSLLATVQGSDTNRSSCLSTALNATPAALEVRFKARIDESAPAQGIEVLNVLFAKPQGSCNVIYSTRDGEWTFDEYCSVNDTTTLVDIHRTGVKVVAGAWVSITSKVDLTSKKASVSLDGALPVDVTLSPGLTTGPATLTVGINYVEVGTARSRVHVDDVFVDVK
ncbi:MAG: hypothetical protein JST00_45700 [Deltaproteobacteria bacterium]|nr:hypothetical protein [Deltaproteobacteria bacterium]